jgi:hypothetical protein
MVQTPGDRLQSYWPRRSSEEAPAARHAVTESGERIRSQRLAKFMADYPVVTLAAAALAGAALGWMVKRK